MAKDGGGRGTRDTNDLNTRTIYIGNLFNELLETGGIDPMSFSPIITLRAQGTTKLVLSIYYRADPSEMENKIQEFLEQVLPLNIEGTPEELGKILRSGIEKAKALSKPASHLESVLSKRATDPTQFKS